MTTTRTRTTRKGYTARLLTAVLAVLAVVAASLTFAASAAVARGDHDRPEEVQKVGICHHDNGKREYTPNVVSIMSVNNVTYFLDYNGHGDHSDDIIPMIEYGGTVLFPGQGDQSILTNGCKVPTTLYTVTEYTDPTTFCDDDETVVLTGKGTATWGTDHKADATTEAAARVIARERAARDLAKQARGMDPGSCPTEPIVGYGEASYTHPAFCYLGVDQDPVIGEPVTVRLPGEWTDQATADAAAQALAEQQAMDEVNSYVDERYPGHTDGTCIPDGVVYTQTAGASGETDFCAADGVTTVTVQWSGTGTATSTASDAEALFLAQQLADQAGRDDLTAKTPAGATLGACGLVAVAPVEPATVAPVEPATVAPVEPATVAVPAAATVPLPASVPAGDGSGIPTTPVWLLVLLTLGTATVVATGTRLAMARNR